jgi:hypothetical protein
LSGSRGSAGCNEATLGRSAGLRQASLPENRRGWRRQSGAIFSEIW